MYLDGKYLQEFEEIIGCDEAGRGPIAGPVVGCAVKVCRENKNLFRNLKKLGVNDSKKIPALKRAEILRSLDIDVSRCDLDSPYKKVFKNWHYEFVISWHSSEDIDRMNILQASLSCMKRAAHHLVGERSCRVLVDGNKGFEFLHQVEPVIKGDQRFLTISLASIIAKEFRDEKMRQLDLQYPGYGLKKHAGYPTAEHRAAVEALGVSPIHRKSFRGVKEYATFGEKVGEEGEPGLFEVQEENGRTDL